MTSLMQMMDMHVIFFFPKNKAVEANATNLAKLKAKREFRKS